MIYTFKLFEKFIAFVVERHAIYERRKAGKSAPWTKDPILAAYRFCNVYRELDRTTMWIAKWWRDPYKDYDHLWFDMVIARLVNHPETLAALSEIPAWSSGWNKKIFLDVMRQRKTNGVQVFGGAYIITTGGRAGDKAIYLANEVLDPMWKHRERLKPTPEDTLKEFHERLMGEQAMGSFMAAQVVADVKYALPLRNAKDWWTFAASGPGSRRGMAYLMGFDPRMRWKEHEWHEALMELSDLMRPRLRDEEMPRMHNQDLQNCLCEFSKYRRTELGTGRPKQKFAPHVET